MRSYAKNFTYKKTATYQQRQTRMDTEWDVRIDVTPALTAETICSFIRENLDKFQYIACSGIERPDPVITDNHRSTHGDGGGWHGSTENHVHLCVILEVPAQRLDVLKLLRGPRKMGDEYAVPRNRKFPYAGWVIHHAKPGFKIDDEPLLRLEHGTLALDPFTTEWALKIQHMLKKYGSPGMASRFSQWTDLITRDAIKAKIEKLQMQLEDNDALPFVFPTED